MVLDLLHLLVQQLLDAFFDLSSLIDSLLIQLFFQFLHRYSHLAEVIFGFFDFVILLFHRLLNLLQIFKIDFDSFLDFYKIILLSLRILFPCLIFKGDLLSNLVDLLDFGLAGIFHFFIQSINFLLFIFTYIKIVNLIFKCSLILNTIKHIIL